MADGVILICRESVYVFEIMILFYNFVTVLEYKGKHKYLGVIIQIIFLSVFQRLMQYLNLYLTGNVVMSITLNMVCMFMMNIAFYKGTLRQRIWSIVMYAAPAYMAEITTFPLLRALALSRGDFYNASYVVLNFSAEYNKLGVILCGQIILIYWGIMILLWKVLVEKSWIKEYFMFLIIPIYQSCLFFVYYSGCGELNSMRIMAGYTLFWFGIFVDAVIIYLVNGALKKVHTEKELKQVSLKRQKELEYYQAVNIHMEQVRGVKHEFANQLQVIYSLLEEKDEKKAKKMLDAAYENLESTFNEPQGENEDDT